MARPAPLLPAFRTAASVLRIPKEAVRRDSMWGVWGREPSSYVIPAPIPSIVVRVTLLAAAMSRKLFQTCVPRFARAVGHLTSIDALSRRCSANRKLVVLPEARLAEERKVGDRPATLGPIQRPGPVRAVAAPIRLAKSPVPGGWPPPRSTSSSRPSSPTSSLSSHSAARSSAHSKRSAAEYRAYISERYFPLELQTFRGDFVDTLARYVALDEERARGRPGAWVRRARART